MTQHKSVKEPRTDRGRKTRRKLLEAARTEFGEKGFHAASVSSITRSASVASGTFYTYFDSKNALFRALINDISMQVGEVAGAEVGKRREEPGTGAIDIEEAALLAFLRFAREHKEVYRVIDEAEFVDEAAYRNHYNSTAARIKSRLAEGIAQGDMRAISDEDLETYAWAIMGMNVFLGLRFAVWGEPDERMEPIAATANDLIARGLVADD